MSLPEAIIGMYRDSITEQMNRWVIPTSPEMEAKWKKAYAKERAEREHWMARGVLTVEPCYYEDCGCTKVIT